MHMWGLSTGDLLQRGTARPVHWETSDAGICVSFFLGLVRFPRKVSSSLLPRELSLTASVLMVEWEDGDGGLLI